MAVNYFSQLGFDQAMNKPFDVAQSVSGLRTQSLNRDLAQQQAGMQQQQMQQKQSAFEDAKIRQRTAEASGLIYSALSSGQPKRAAEIATQFEGEFKALDPTFSAANFAQMTTTPEGLKQLTDETLQLTQIMAGPDQAARFNAQMAKPAEQMTAYQATQTDLRKQEIEMQREKAKLDALMKAEQQQTNEIKKQELQLKIQQQEQKLVDAEKERETQSREKSASLESGLQGIDNLLSTLDQILKTPMGVVESATGPISTRLPTLSQGTADFEELINKFDSQAFIAQIPMLKGTGALSDSEGKKLSASLQNLSLRQSPKQLIKNVQEVRQIMEIARQNLLKKYGEQPQDVVDWSKL
jgi:hypothetical protein